MYNIRDKKYVNRTKKPNEVKTHVKCHTFCPNQTTNPAPLKADSVLSTQYRGTGATSHSLAHKWVKTFIQNGRDPGRNPHCQDQT
jgi:hypothetical protein